MVLDDRSSPEAAATAAQSEVKGGAEIILGPLFANDVRQVGSVAKAAGVPVIGVTDHHFIRSIYFFDPNGIRLELTTFVGEPAYMAEKQEAAGSELAAWTSEKRLRAEQAETA